MTSRDVFSIKCMQSDDIICPQSEKLSFVICSAREVKGFLP